MKRSLGRIVMLMVLVSSCGWGINYQWHLVQSPKTLQVGQSALVQYECRYEGSAAEYSIKLNLHDNPQYALRVLAQQDRVVKGNRVNTFNLLLTPKQSGHIDVHVNGEMEYVSPGSIDYTAHFGRENVSQKDVIITKTTLPPFALDAQSNTTSLIGDIMMEVRTDRIQVRAHEPLHLSVLLRGSGNLDQASGYELNISGVKIFSEAPQKQLTPSPEGVSGEVRQEFALVAEKSYVIAPIQVRVFDTAHNRIKILRSEPITIRVDEGYDPASLLDVPNIDRSAMKRYGIYIGLILFGVMLGEAVRRLWKHRPRRKVKQFYDDAKTVKELVMLLSLSGDKEYESIIAELEAGNIVLGEAKKKLGRLSTDKKVTL